ncbi:peroxidase 66-like [Chenopodium quinoa]|uniref:Peroxidase n=1 Tax=Chenopodium quinoa TaxID=63459 RepID=A0A803M0L1_CHEQI|nr:peroxidase 66-like [Chenopodium quinoa]
MLRLSHEFIFFVFAILVAQTKAKQLDSHYYEQTCPHVERIIRDVVHKATLSDTKVPPRILRMFFHDCFVRGCDASVLLDSTDDNLAEKDGPPNISLRAYYVIDKAKAKLEKACPQTVSCADIIAIAARDVVNLAGGPYWNVLKGRKDGKTSRANETLDLPTPSFNATKLIKLFSKKGLGIKDLVTLSGAHTLGFSHCSSFKSRIHRFDDNFDMDPSMDIMFANTLKQKCASKHNRDNNNSGYYLDSTSSVFDNEYYKRLVARKGVLATDQALYNDYRTKFLVESYARYEALFFVEFAASMVKLGNLGVNDHHHGEVREKCRFVN